MEFDKLSHQVIGCALEVHRALGPGLLESTYEECLAYELTGKQLAFVRQTALQIEYKELILPRAYRVDLVIEQQLIVELKSVELLNDLHMAQVLTYMRLSGIRTGLLININVKALKQGLRRLVL